MALLILIRHGQSVANQENIYTGWTDSPLTLKGSEQAKKAAQTLKKNQISNVFCYHTSILQRAIKTSYIIQEELNDLYKPLIKTWRLNERHYGALRGLNKEKTKQIYGEKQVALWRRSFDTQPPKLKFRDQNIGRYKKLDYRAMPLSESLEDASKRVIPYFQERIAKGLKSGKNQMVIAHGSTLRALIKYLESISDEDIDGVEVGNAEPIIYEFDNRLNIINKRVLKKPSNY